MKTSNITSNSFMIMMTVILLFTLEVSAQKVLADGSSVVKSKKGFNETVDILKGAIEQQNLMVIHEIDGQKMMRMAGAKTGGMKQIFYFHPKFMRKVLEANNMAGMAIPLKMIVMEKKGKVMVKYILASTALKQYKGTEGVASEVDKLIGKIISELKK